MKVYLSSPYTFIAALNLADLERGLFLISSKVGVIGFFVKILIKFSLDLSRKKFFTIRSSKEWKEITASLPPFFKISRA